MEKIGCPICKIRTNYNKIKRHLVSIHNFSEADAIKFKIRQKNSNIEFEEIKKDYLENELSFQDIADKYRISREDSCQIIEVVFQIEKRTNSESKKTRKYKEKYEKTIKIKYGVDNISQSEKIKKKKAETFFKNYGVENNFCREEVKTKAALILADKLKDEDFKEKIKENNKETLKRKYGVENVSQINFVKNKISNAQKNRFGKLTKEEKKELTQKAREFRLKNGNISKLENIVSNILDELSIHHERNKKILNVFVDLYIEINERKIIIECQGDFWHLNPSIYKPSDINAVTKKSANEIWDKDIERSYFLSKNGFEVYWFWEKEKKLFEEFIIQILNKEKETWNSIKLKE